MSTVTIGCKLPNGIYMESGELKRVRINGWNNNEIAGLSHGITRDVPADLWAAWSKEHAESKLIKSGIVFAEETEKRAIDKAKDQKDNKSGHEQLAKIKKTDAAGGLGEADR
jgi:hypothetical protein